ncbi:MAG: DEAD/DEAH box helicase [Pseudomonadales bacterium]|jgi:ATP-dependent RNA helicase RhlE|tara:strand:- start:32 stop:1279 length:1248 start_codon:yes stop_codon:yes gene_type:complete
MTFSKLGLCEPILKAVLEQGYTAPTPIQAKVIPEILAGRSVVASAQTGTGKTAGFVLPILERLKGERKRRAKRMRALIIEPTRELAVQVQESIRQYARHLDVVSMAMFGGVDTEQQKQQLIEGVDILVATPGRLLDMIHQRALHFDELEILVLDEADRMLDMGFIGDINKIIERLPEQRQNLLLSATMSDDVRRLADTNIENAVEISFENDWASAPKITQWLVTVDKHNKSALLSHLISEHQWTQALVFIRTKHGAAKLASQLVKRGINAEAIHSDRSQANRSKILAEFKSGELPILIGTGIAARGIDIDNLERVVNYDLPDDADDYIHRIGRTGRAGASGEAVSLVSNDDFKRLCAIESRLGQLIGRRDNEAFKAVKEVPISILDFVKKSARESTGRRSTDGNKPVNPWLKNRK